MVVVLLSFPPAAGGGRAFTCCACCLLGTAVLLLYVVDLPFKDNIVILRSIYSYRWSEQKTNKNELLSLFICSLQRGAQQQHAEHTAAASKRFVHTVLRTAVRNIHMFVLLYDRSCVLREVILLFWLQLTCITAVFPAGIMAGISPNPVNILLILKVGVVTFASLVRHCLVSPYPKMAALV